MSRTRAFFLEEATECLRFARRELQRDHPDRDSVYRAVRRLRGSAQLARFSGLAARAGTLEMRLRGSQPDWSPGLARTLVGGVMELEGALDSIRAGRTKPDDEMESTMAAQERRGEEVGIEELEYRGEAALERALDLREALEDAILSDAPAAPLLDEIFDLIRLGMK